jgi:hypothetical protein
MGLSDQESNRLFNTEAYLFSNGGIVLGDISSQRFEVVHGAPEPH